MTVLVEGNEWSKPKYRNRKIQKHWKCLVVHCLFSKHTCINKKNPLKTNKTNPNPLPKKPSKNTTSSPNSKANLKNQYERYFSLLINQWKKLGCIKKLLKEFLSLLITSVKPVPVREVTVPWNARAGDLKSQRSCQNTALGTISTGWLKRLQGNDGSAEMFPYICQNQRNFTYSKQGIQIICNQCGSSHLQMLLSLLALCFKWCNKNPGEENLSDAEIDWIVSAKVSQILNCTGIF